jgi:hypothetical protein
VVEDLVQVVSSQEKELAAKSALVADLQQQLENSGNLLSLLSLMLYSPILGSQDSAMQMLQSSSPHLRG